MRGFQFRSSLKKSDPLVSSAFVRRRVATKFLSHARKKPLVPRVAKFLTIHVPKAVYGYCVTWQVRIFSPSAHNPYGLHALTLAP